MKLLVMCEGSNEKVIMNILLKNGYLKFSEDDLLGLEISRVMFSRCRKNTEIKLLESKNTALNQNWRCF